MGNSTDSKPKNSEESSTDPISSKNSIEAKFDDTVEVSIFYCLSVSRKNLMIFNFSVAGCNISPYT